MNANVGRATIRIIKYIENPYGKHTPFNLEKADVIAKKGLFNFSKLRITARPTSTISLSLTTANTIKYKNENLDFNDYKVSRLLAGFDHKNADILFSAKMR